MSTCPQCAFVNHASATFCARCGLLLRSCLHCNAAVQPKARFCQRCGQPLPHGTSLTSSTSTCPACGQENKEGAQFCRHCGASLTAVFPISCPACGYALKPGARFCPQCGLAQGVQAGMKYRTGKLPPNALLHGSEGAVYVVQSLVARGGMGAVYKVLRAGDQSIWAAKEMSESAVSVEEWKKTVTAFYAEAHLLQSLAHENLPKVIDVFAHNQRHYMVMEFIEGQSLTEIMAESGGSVAEGQALEWGRQLCQVLHYLHTHNPPIIYRDLKPDNVMVETASNRVKLIDFGIARRYKSGKKSDTVHLGTSGYAAPEQYGRANRQSDAATDIYALGATLHHLLTGLDPAQTPFSFPDVRIHAKVSVATAAAIAKAVKPRAEDRHRSAAAMYEALTGEPFPAITQAQTRPTPPPLPPETHSETAVAPILPVTFLQADPVPRGANVVLSLPVSISNGTATVQAEASWLRASPTVADSSTSAITLTAETKQLRFNFAGRAVPMPPRHLPGQIIWLLLWPVYAHARYLVPATAVHRTAVFVGPARADVQIEVEPGKMRRRIGWLLSSTAVAAEITLLIWIIWFLLTGQ